MKTSATHFAVASTAQRNAVTGHRRAAIRKRHAMPSDGLIRCSEGFPAGQALIALREGLRRDGWFRKHTPIVVNRTERFRRTRLCLLLGLRPSVQFRLGTIHAISSLSEFHQFEA
jgi:hypothetical protein